MGVRVPGHVVRRGRCELDLERIAPFQHRRAHRHLPSRRARAWRRVRRCAARRGRRRRRPSVHPCLEESGAVERPRKQRADALVPSGGARLELKVERRVPTRRRSSWPSPWGGRSSTRARVPGRVVRRGRCGVERWRRAHRQSSGRQRFKAPLVREAGRTDNALFTPAAHRHLPSRCARVAARSPMSGTSPATRANECGRSSSPPWL